MNAFTHDQVIDAEVASEILNRARALIMSRVYKIEAADPASASHLMEQHDKLRALQLSLRVTDPDGVDAVTSQWGPLLKNEAAFWAAIEGFSPQTRG